MKKKILVVEDDVALAEMYDIRLKAEGYKVKTVHNGDDALVASVKFNPDLIITGILMPEISGFDVIDILKNTPETKHIPILVLSALRQPEYLDRARKLGAIDYLCKSQVIIKDVVEVIQAILNGGYKTFSYADSRDYFTDTNLQ